MQGAVYVVVAMNAAVALGALAMHIHERRATAVTVTQEPMLSASPLTALSFASMLVIACAGGFVALFLFCGIVTEAISATRRELKRMRYLELPAPGRTGSDRADTVPER